MINAIEQAEQFANVLDNELGISTRFYESLDSFGVSPIADGLRTYSVIGFCVGQPIAIFEGGSMPEMVRKFFPYDWDDEEIRENYYDEAFMGFYDADGVFFYIYQETNPDMKYSYSCACGFGHAVARFDGVKDVVLF